MLFSVVVCTRNRVDSLKLTLGSLMRQTIPAETYEVIVVDNASTDSTSTVVQEWQKRFNNVRYVYEPNLGLNRARNRGWREASGRWVAYIDDDARAVPNWLGAWERVEHTTRLGGAYGGGKVLADWGYGKPSWLPAAFEIVYTTVDHGNELRVLGPNEFILGTNMFFLRDLLENFPFDERIGVVGEGISSTFGDESDLITRLRISGHAPIYCPESIVWHMVASGRLRRAWFLKRMYASGKSQPILDRKHTNSNPYTWHRSLYDTKQALIALFRAGICFRREQEMFEWLAVAGQKLGRASEEIRGIFGE